MHWRRLLLPGAAAVAIAVTTAAPAWAHASFDVTGTPASGTVEAELRVPIERDSTNAFIDVEVPAGWTVEECTGASGWSCATSQLEGGETVVNLAAAETGAGSVERFGLTLGAPPAEGSYVFPVIQTYADGVEVPWIDRTGGDRPAPRIQVGHDAGSVEVGSDPPDHGDPDAEAGAGDGPASEDEPTDDTAGDTSGGTADATAADGATDGAAATSGGGELPDDFAPADGARTARPGPDAGDGSPVPWFLGAAGVAVVVAAAFALARR